MATRPFHHGNLRPVLLDHASEALRERGVDGLSLRDLARRAGVSHGAPRSHFIDKRALLDALAEQGFDRLTEKVRSAGRAPGSVEERLRLVGRAYVDFAVRDAALLELMFASKVDNAGGAVHDAATRLFQALDDAMTDSSSAGGDTDAWNRFKLLFAAIMQGTATLISAGRITHTQGGALVDDATHALLTSELGAHALPLQ